MPRLMRFFEANPGISLRIYTIKSVEMLRSVKVDMAILWGIGDWRGYESGYCQTNANQFLQG